MKIINIITVAALAIIFSGPAFAQNRPTQQALLTAATASCTPTNQQSSLTMNVGPADSAATVQVSGTFSGTANFVATADGANFVAIVGSPAAGGVGVTSVTSAGVWQLNVAGYVQVCVFASTFASGAINVRIVSSQGTPDDSAITIIGTVTTVLANTSGTTGGLPVAIVGCSGATCFSSQVMGAAVAVNTTTVAPFGVTTTLVQGIFFNNSCQASVTVTITDGNNVPFVGTTTNGSSFSLAAVSNLPINMGIVGHVFTSGLAISANTASCIKLWTEGRQ